VMIIVASFRRLPPKLNNTSSKGNPEQMNHMTGAWRLHISESFLRYRSLRISMVGLESARPMMASNVKMQEI
jgi:hypothetical protein